MRRNVVGEPAAPPQPARERYARSLMTRPVVRLARDQAKLLEAEFERTAGFRGWTVLARAVMYNHVHLVVGVVGDPDPSSILRDFKRRGSWALNQVAGGRSQRWWTRGGSTRRLAREANVLRATRYVRRQWRPLAVWVHPSVE